MPEIFGLEQPFVSFCGIEPVSMERGHTVLRGTVLPEHCNSMGIAHGGFLMTLLDVAVGSAGRSMTEPQTTVMSVDLHTSFLAPGRGTLTAEGRVVRAGRSLLFVDATITDEAGTLVARASSILKTVTRRAVQHGGGA